jgi:toxin ParE1/3/4
MPRRNRVWRVELTSAAIRDLDDIADWTIDRFGAAQARAYSQTLKLAFRALRFGPTLPTIRTRPDLGPGLLTLHAARIGRRARHVILFRTDPGERVIEVLRVLHEKMELARHLPPEDDQKGEPS